MNKNLLIGIVAVVLVIGGFLVLGGQQTTPSPTTTSTQDQVTQQVPAETGSGVEETVVKEDGKAMEEEEGAMMEAREIVVEGDEYSFSPTSITVKAGEKIKLTFNNIGNIPHNFTVEGLGVATRTIGAGQSATVEFTADQTGTFTLYCSVGNHRALGMEGELIVE